MSWPTVIVENVCSEIVDCVNKTAPTIEGPTNYRMIRTSNIKNGRLVLDNARYVEKDVFDLWTRRVVPRRGDVIFTREAPLGEVAIIRDEVNLFLGQRTVLYRADERVLSSQFLLYAFLSNYVQDQVYAFEGSGSTVSHIRVPDCKQFLIPLPPLPEQRRIAAVLGALDDKIELNRKMNQTLEEIAQTIFKSWFVDFDGYDDLVESEIGPVPRGWEIGSIEAIAENVRNTISPTKVDAMTPYIGLEHVPRKSAAIELWGKVEDVTSAKAQFIYGDVLFGKLRPYFHKVIFAPFSGVCSTDILVVRPKSCWRWFVFNHLYSDEMVAHASASADGTKMPRAKWSDLCRYKIALPPEPLVKEYERLVSYKYERIVLNVEESRTLSELRDTLLPKLISGELRVSEAEALVAEVV